MTAGKQKSDQYGPEVIEVIRLAWPEGVLQTLSKNK